MRSTIRRLWAMAPADQTPVRDPIVNDDYVYVWSDKKAMFLLTYYRDVVCPECGETWEGMVWDDNHGTPGTSMLVCECGEQFYQTLD